MEDSKPPNKEVDDSVLIEEIYQINVNSLGEGAVTCQSCGEEIGEGDTVLAYFLRPPLNNIPHLGMVCCTEHGPCTDTEFTLGIQELVIEGRVGMCSDQATQSSWPVLLAPHLTLLSPPDSDEAIDVRARGIKMTVPTTEEPDVWPVHLPDGEMELIEDPEAPKEAQSD